MIKLVATDMDGTLLNSKKELPARLFPILRQLFHRGIRFAIASGRQYYSLLQTFEPVRDEIIFISENGAMVVEHGRCLSLTEVPAHILKEAVQTIRDSTGIMPVLCGEKSAYIENDTPFFLQNVKPYYIRCQQVPDILEAAADDRICKIAAFDLHNAETGAYPLLKMFGEKVTVSLSGNNWVDLMSPHVNKGNALRACQQRLDITPEECMAFGDYLNDVEMMRACDESYAMANAHPDLKAVCRHTAKSNDEDGVLETLCSVFDLHSES